MRRRALAALLWRGLDLGAVGVFRLDPFVKLHESGIAALLTWLLRLDSIDGFHSLSGLMIGGGLGFLTTSNSSTLPTSISGPLKANTASPLRSALARWTGGLCIPGTIDGHYPGDGRRGFCRFGGLID